MHSTRFFSIKTSPPTLLFVMGGPGSGKGTLCENLKGEQKFCHISTGNLIRDFLTQPSSASHDLRREMKEGVLFDARFILDLIKKEIEKHPTAPGFLIDGCPRTLEQWQLFKKEIGPPTDIIFLDTTEKNMETRMLARAKIEKREDDNEETINKRIQSFQKQTMPVITLLEELYPQQFHQIDASKAVEVVTLATKQSLMKQTFPKKKVG